MPLFLSKVRSRAAAVLILATALSAVSGCSNNVPVRGRVMVPDKPLSSGSVLFIPDKSKNNDATVEPRGFINEEGFYELTTDGKPGAPPGWYKVVVSAVEQVDLNDPTAPPARSLVAAKYNKPDTTDLQVEVKAGAPCDLQLVGPE
jgi:hypothetical protein